MTDIQCKPALIIIDLQNEFLSPGGRFLIHKDSRPFLKNLPALTTAFRAYKYPIIWIRSEYANNFIEAPEGEPSQAQESVDFLSGTHTGKTPCCAKDSFGAGFPSELEALINYSSADGGDSDNIILTKTWYSAFKETSLLAELKQRKISRIFVAGLLTNVCVNATVIDACNLGFDVNIIEDCLGWRKRASHDRAVREMSRLGVQACSIKDFYPDGSEAPTFDFPPASYIPELYIVNGSIPSWRVLMALHEKNVKFRSTRLLVMSNPKETRLPEFLALNHRGKTPVFVDVIPSSSDAPNDPPDQVVVNESLAILHYIEASFKSACVLLPHPTDHSAYARALARIQETENLRLIYDALEDAHFDAELHGEKLSFSERMKMISAVDKELDYWETYAGQAKFIAGDDFGLADCALFPILAYMVHRGFEWKRVISSEFQDAWPNLKLYHDKVWERGGEGGAAQKSQPDGWHKKGKANVWRGTNNGAKGLYHGKT